MSAGLCLGRMTWADRTALGGLGKFALVEPARGHQRLRRSRAPAAGSRAPAGCRPGDAARRDRSARAQDAAAERGAEIAGSDPKRGAAQSRWCRRQNPPSQAACGSQGRAAKPSGHVRQRSLPPANGGSSGRPYTTRKDQHAAFCEKTFPPGDPACRRIAGGGMRGHHQQLDRQLAEPDRDRPGRAQRHGGSHHPAAGSQRNRDVRRPRRPPVPRRPPPPPAPA